MKGIERNAFLKVFLLISFTSLLILSLALGGSFAYERYFSWENKLPMQAMIGTVSVGGMKESDAVTTVENFIENWKQKANIELHFFDESVNISIDELHFEVEESVRNALKEGYANFIPTIHLATLEEKIKELPFQNFIHLVSLQSLQKGIEEQLYTLENEMLMLDLNEYLLEEEQLLADVVVSVSKQVPYKNILSTWIDTLNGVTINKHSVFSLLEVLEEAGRTPIKGEELNILASTMYELLLKTNFVVVERHIGREVPNYTQIGFDAIAIPNEADLKFLNANFYDYEIRATYENDRLTVELYGIPFFYTYDIEVEEERVLPRKIVHFSSKRSIGEVQTIRYGQNGYLVHVTKIVRKRNNEFIEKIDISEDFYPPIHQIEERSLYTPPIIEEETEDEFDNDYFNDGSDIDEEESQDDEPIYEDPMFNGASVDEEEEKQIIDDPLELPPTQK